MTAEKMTAENMTVEKMTVEKMTAGTSVENMEKQKLFNSETAAIILQNLEKIEFNMDEEKRKALESKGYFNIELLNDKTSEDKRPIIKYDCKDGLLTHYIYPDKIREFYILNDEKLKDEEIRKKYIIEPEDNNKKLGVKERRELNRRIINETLKEKGKIKKDIKKQIRITKSLLKERLNEAETNVEAKPGQSPKDELNKLKKQLEQLEKEFRNVEYLV